MTTVTTKAAADSKSWVEEQILEANTVLESFGNAKTVRNNNSSRFGKFVQVLLDGNVAVIGASIVNYLLEKSRVVRQAQTERNYHVFYELMAGTSAEDKTKLKLPAKPTDFYYLNQSGCVDIPNVNDKKNFEALKLALTVLKMPATDLEALLRVVSAILHLGNAKFVKDDAKDCSALDGSSNAVVKTVSELLDCDQAKLTSALLNRRLTVRGESTLVPLKKQQAEDNRDSIAKSLYDKMFNYIVAFVNDSTATKLKPANFIGVLDIFGFELFEVNSFEQLCINYTNEKLQQFFNSFIFKLEQEEYKKENVPWESITFSDNQKCLDLIEAKGGLLSMLDEECKVPNGTDDTLLNKMHTAHAKNEHYVKPRTSGSVFGVKHYAGEVTYTVSGFLDKNRDAIPDEIIELFKAAKLAILPKMFADAVMSTEKTKKATTAGANFKSQLETLVTTLNTTQPHYVRCVKPNFEKQAFKFDPKLTLAQLRYAGMLETIRIRKVGFPSRLPYDQFNQRFRLLIKGGGDDKTKTVEVLNACKVDKALFKLGATKVFMKPEVVDTLVDHNNVVKVKFLIRVQKLVRGLRARRKYLLTKESAEFLQKYLKMFVYRERYLKKRKAIIKIQSAIRGHYARDYARQLRREKAEAEEAARRAKEEEEKAKLAAAEKAAREEEERKKEAERQEQERLRRLEEQKLAEYKAANQKPVEAPAPETTKAEDDAIVVTPVKQEEPKEPPQAPPAPPLSKVASKINVAPRRALKFNPLAKAADAEKEAPKEEEDKSLKSYAEKNFNKHPKPTGTLAAATFRKPKDFLTIDDMLVHTRVPIPMTMIKTGTSENMNNIAIEAFKNLTRLLELKGDESYQMSKKLVEIGIQYPDLRDELYIQVIRQVTPNPALTGKSWTEIGIGGWTLLALYCSSFPPTKMFSKYLLHYISGFVEADKPLLSKSPVGKLAEYCNTSVKSIMVNGARRFAPSALENEYITSASQMQCRVHLLDGSYKTLTVSSSNTASDLVRDLANKIDLKDSNGWSLYEVASDFPWGERMVKGKDYIADLHATWEKDGKLVAPDADPSTPKSPTSKIGGTIAATFKKKAVITVKAGVIGEGPIKLYMKKRVIKNPNEFPDDPVDFKLTFYQSALDVRNDVYPLNDEIASKLASLKAQAEYGDFTDVSAANLNKLEQFLPQSLVSTKKDALINAATEEYKKLKGTPTFGARIKFLETLQTFKHHGSAVFAVQYVGFWQHAGNVVLGISATGVQFMSKAKVPFESFTYKQLYSWETDADTITLNILRTAGVPQADNNAAQAESEGSAVESFKFRSTVAEDISVLIKDYSPKVGADKKKERELYVAESEVNYLDKNLDKARIGLLKKKLVVFGEGEAPKSKPTALADLFKNPNDKPEGTDATAVPGAGEPGKGDAKALGGITEEEEDAETTKIIDGPSKAAPPKAQSAKPEPPKAEATKPELKVDTANADKDTKPDSPKKAGLTVRGMIKGLTVRGEKGGTVKGKGTVKVPRSPDQVNDQSIYLSEWNSRLLSLVPPLLTQFAANPSLQRASVRLNDAILDYLRMPDPNDQNKQQKPGAAPTKQGPPSTPEWVMIKTIIDACFTEMKLVDELYMELLRYTADQMPPDSRQVLRVWKVFAVAVGTLRPRLPEVAELVRCHLRRFSVIPSDTPQEKQRKEECLYGKYCLKQFPRMIQNEQRRFAPGEDEIKFVIKLSPVFAKVYMPDGQYRALSFEPHTTVEDLTAVLNTKLKLTDPGYAIYAAKGNLERSLAVKETLCDVLGKWDKNAKNAGGDPTKEPRFVLKRRLFPNPSQPSTSNVDEEFLLGQVIDQIIQGRHPLSLEDAVFLAGMRAQVEDGDEQAGKKVDYKLLMEKYVPKKLHADKVVTDIQQAHISNRGKNAAECRKSFMKRVRMWPLYGSTIFDVNQSYTSDYPKDCWLLINHEGISVAARGSKEMILSIPYTELASATPDGNSIMITNQNRDKKLVFQTILSTQIAALVRDYQALKAPAS